MALKAWDKNTFVHFGQGRDTAFRGSVFPETWASEWPEGTQPHQVPSDRLNRGLSILSFTPYGEAFCKHLIHFVETIFHLLLK